MPFILKPSHVPLPPQDVAKLHDYKKKWLEAVRVSNVRSDTTTCKFSTLPIGLYESEPPPNIDFNILSFFQREANTQATKEKVIFYKGSVFVRTEEEDMLIVTNEDVHVHDGTHTVVHFTQDREDYLQFNWQSTETVDLESCTATSFPAFSMSERASFADGIRLNERQFEELISNRSNSDISGGINDDLAPENGSDSDEDMTEQIGRCNLPGRSRSNRMITFNE